MIELIVKPQTLELINSAGESTKEIYDKGFNDGEAQGYELGKTDGYAEGLPVGIEQGKAEENEAFWDSITNNNKRVNYNRAFFYWNCEYMHPPYKIAFTDVQSGLFTFAYNKSLKKIEKDYFDFSKKATAVNSNASWQNTFDNCENLEEIEDIGLRAQYSYIFTFRTCRKLHTIAKIGTDANTGWNNVFGNCDNLKNITIDGTIAQNGFNISPCKKLTQASLISILEACNIDVTAAPVTITLPSKCIDGKTDTEALLESLGGHFENTVYTYGASTIQLPHTNIKPNSISLIPVDENGAQTNADWIDDGNGNIINPWYPEDSQFVGTINYATGLIDISSGYGYFGILNKYTKCQYTVDSAYNMALSKGYNIAFA